MGNGVALGRTAVAAHAGTRQFNVQGNGIYLTGTAHLGAPVKLQHYIDRRSAEFHLRKTETAHIAALTELEIVLLQVHYLGRRIQILITNLIKELKESGGASLVKGIHIRSSSTTLLLTYAVTGTGSIGNCLEPFKVVFEVDLFIKTVILDDSGDEAKHLGSQHTVGITGKGHLMAGQTGNA